MSAVQDSPNRVSTTRLGRPRPQPVVAAKKVQFHKVTSADGTRIEAWSNGVEGPTVLLCNGLGTNPYAWPELLKPDCGIHVISWNHRGVGRSSRPEDPANVTVDSFVEDAIAVLDDAGVESCVVAGWSFGVNTAFELAGRHPERVAGILSVAGVPGGTFASMGAPLYVPRPLREPLAVTGVRLMQWAAPVLTPLARRIPMGPVSTTALRFSGFMFPTAKSKDVKRAVREFLTTPVDWYMHLALAASEHQRVSLSSIHVPTAFVAGRFDLLASHHDMRTASERLEDSTYVNLFGTHFLPLEKSGVISEVLHDLVARAGVDAGS